MFMSFWIYERYFEGFGILVRIDQILSKFSGVG